MTEVFRYSVIRFRPFAETGEFANIGIIMVSVHSGKVGFALAPKRFSRIKGFFDAAVHEAYSSAITSLEVELARISVFLPNEMEHKGSDIFNNTIETKESSVIFSESRAILGDDFSTVLDKLFTRFVKREFTTSDQPETLLTREIRYALNRHGIKQFKSLKIPDPIVPVVFPLAYVGSTIRAIKPLSFAQKNPLSVFDHGAHWRRRLQYLLDRNKIQEGNVLLAYEQISPEADRHMREAFYTAIDEFRDLPFKAVKMQYSGRVNPDIIAFAEDSVPYEVRKRGLFN